MSILACGVNHTTAPIAVREKLAFAESVLPDLLKQAKHHRVAEELVILSTCNRTEFYCRQTDKATLFSWIADISQIPVSQVEKFFYSLEHEAAIQHVMRVASGLDSMVFGEPQILGQMKQAFAIAQQNQSVAKQLQKLFQLTFNASKQIRHDTVIGKHPTSIASVAVNLAKTIFTDLANATVLILGAGDTAKLVSMHLYNQNVRNFIFANRSIENAKTLVDEYSGVYIPLNSMPAHLHQADIIISTTHSKTPIILKNDIQQASKKRKHKPLYLVDLAIPRDIEPGVEALPDVFLYNIDHLQQVSNQNQNSRKQAAHEAEQIIEKFSEDYLTWQQSLKSDHIIHQFCQRTEYLKSLELKQAIKELEQGVPARVILEQLASRLTKRLNRAPLQQLRQAGENDQLHLMTALCQQLHVLEKEETCDNESESI